jgi:hypothetical protein
LVMKSGEEADGGGDPMASSSSASGSRKRHHGGDDEKYKNVREVEEAERKSGRAKATEQRKRSTRAAVKNATEPPEQERKVRGDGELDKFR